MDEKYRIPITGMQRYIIDYQFNRPKSTMYNLGYLFKFSLEINEELFLQSVVSAIQAHPIMNSAFYFDDNDGELRQKQLDDQPLEITVERISETELESVKESLIEPFFLTNHKMYRCRIFKTEMALYLFLDIHHSIIDGLSFHILLKDIAKAYRGQPVKTETYSYYHVAKEEFEMKESFKGFDTKQYYEKLLAGWDGQALPITDGVKEDFSFGECCRMLDVTVKDVKLVLTMNSIDENVFFMTVMALTNALYNRADDAVFYWIHNGRSSLKQCKIIGLMMKEHLVRINVSDDIRIEELFGIVKAAKDDSMEDTFYPYYEHECLTSKNEIPCFLFQGNIKSSFAIGNGENFSIEEMPNNYKAAQSSMDVEIAVEDKNYTILVEYCAGLYREESIQKWIGMFNTIANQLICVGSVEEIKKHNG